VVTLDDSVPLDPKTFGEELRRVRESSGLELEDISAETKISRRILEALEAGSFRALPERVFCRSFVAQVAATIGIDETPLVAAFDRAWETYATDSGIHLDFRLETAELAPSIRWRFWIPIATGAAILLVAGWVILRGSASVSDGLQPDPRRSGASQVAAEQPTRPPTPPMPHQTATAAVDEPVDDESVVRMTLEVNQGEECWIHYRDGEGMTGQQLLGGGERYSLELPGPVKLTVGNAGAVRVSVDGQTFQDLGLPGQVIHTQVTGAGVTPLRTGGLGG
jgi:cytoskeleton protein RodZ